MKRILTIALFLSFITLYSQVPQTISWQGIIQDSDGNNLTGNHNLTIQLYDVPTGGTALWTELHNAVAVDNGLVNLSLGSVTPLNISFDKQYWLEITVGESTPMARMKLNAVPYSLYSARTSGIIANDSIVLKDSLGVTRMVFNPNSGTFKMMDNDTTWYEMKVASPPSFYFTLPNGNMFAENFGRDSRESYLYDENFKLLHYSAEIINIESVLGYQVTTHTESEYSKLPNSDDTYKAIEKIDERIVNFESSDKNYNQIIETQKSYSPNGNLTGKSVVEKRYYKGDNVNKKEIISTTYIYDSDGNEIGKNVKIEEINNEINTNITTETYKNNVLRNRETKTYDTQTNIITDKTETFNSSGTKTTEKTEEIANGKVTNRVSNGSQSTVVEQSHNKLIYSNTGSSNYVKIEEDSYLGKFDVSAYIGGQEKKLLSSDENGVYYGTNNNILTNQLGTTFSGSVTSPGTTTFQGTTYHNGTNYFSGNVYGNNAQWNGDVQIGLNGLSSGTLNCLGPATIGGATTINSNTEINGNLTVDGDLTVEGGMDMSESDMTFNSVKSNNDIQAQGAKKFVIDHPTDITKLIQHAAVEANQVYNFYRGNVQTNELGYATVTMPDYFLSINLSSDISYQLTVIDAVSFPQAVIFEEYDEETNSFIIRASVPYATVCWQVTARRNDSYIQGYPFNDVIDK